MKLPQPVKDYLSINLGWAVGTALGVWVSGGISGGHINPAVRHSSLSTFYNLLTLLQITLTLATFRGFPWKKVPVSLPSIRSYDMI